MPVTTNLTPASVASTDYPTVQTPVLGGEKEVYVSTQPSRILGTALVTDDSGTIDYKYVNVPTNSPGPILAVAAGSGILQTSATTITYAGLTGSFTPCGYATNQGFNFPIGRAVELTGTYVAPNSSSVPTAASTLLRGSKFTLIEFPLLNTFHLAGCTNNRSIKVPGRMTKSIPCGMEAAEWTTPGRTQIGSLEVTGLNQGIDNGLGRYTGVKCQVMLVTLREGRIITQRDFCTDWTPTVTESDPEGDSESTMSATSEFSKIAMLPAA